MFKICHNLFWVTSLAFLKVFSGIPIINLMFILYLLVVVLISLACFSSETHFFCNMFFVVFRTQKGGHCTRHSLWRPWKLGVRIVAWSKPRMFCKESLGKIKFRAFPKQVGPRILSLENVDYFGTLVNTTEESKENKDLSKTVMVGSCKLSLYANALAMSMQFIFADG